MIGLNLNTVRPRGATPCGEDPAVRQMTALADALFAPRVAAPEVAREDDETPTTAQVVGAENLAVWTGVRTSSWEWRRKADALLLAFVDEREVTLEPPLVSTGLTGWTATVRGPLGGLLTATAPTAREAILAVWRQYAQAQTPTEAA